MTATEIFALAAGAVIVALTIGDVFQSVLLPRPAQRALRPSAYLTRYGWRLWLGIGMRLRDTGKREDFLGAWPPLILTTLLIIWVGGLILGWGCIFYGLRGDLRPAPGFLGAVYFAGTSLLTIGFGDIVATKTSARLLAILAAATGFGTVAVVTTFLFSVFGAFQRREVFVVAFGQRAGAPPSGVALLRTYAELGLMDEIGDLFKAGQLWVAELMESHLAYPVLPYFRSSHDYESWVGAVGALLDAATLVITAIDGVHQGEARLMHGLGRHLTHDFADYFALAFDGEVGVERSEFDAACATLAAAGLTIRDGDRAWTQFRRLRSVYASRLNAMARNWRIPPAQWVGDRSTIARVHGGDEHEAAPEREDHATTAAR